MALIFEETFAGANPTAVIAAIEANGGVHNLTTDDIVTGRGGYAANITGTKYLKYPTLNNFNFGKGALQLWLKPNWNPTILPATYIRAFSAGWSAAQFFDLWLSDPTDAVYVQSYFHPASISGGSVPYSTEMRSWITTSWGLLEIFWDFTSPTDSFMLIKVDDKFNEWSVCSQTSIDALGEGKYIFVGSGDGPNYQFNGAIDSVKIWDDPADLLPVSVASFPRTKFYNPWNANEADVIALFPDGDGFCSPWETNATRPTDCSLLDAGISPSDDVIFFKKPHLENIYEGCVPTSEEIAANFVWKGAPGQTESIIFNVYSRISLTNVSVTKTSLTGAGTIPTSAMDLRIVKNWWQGSREGGYSFNAIPTWVGELLLHDDTIALETDETLGQFKVPTLPIQDHVTTAMAAGIARQFVLDVIIPLDATAGDYTCTITLTADGGVSVDKVITLTVLPFTLLEYSTERSFFHWHEYLTPISGLNALDIFEKGMQYIKNLGYTSVHLGCYNTSLADLYDMIPIAAAVGITTLRLYGIAFSAGLSEAVNYANLKAKYTADLVAAMVASGFEPWLYGMDEFDHYDVGTPEYNFQVRAAKWVHSIGGKCFAGGEVLAKIAIYDSHCTATGGDGAYDAADYPIEGDPAGDASIDAVDYNIGNKGILKMPPSQPVNAIRSDGIYWQSRDGNVRWHRYNVGYLAYITGLRSTSNMPISATDYYYNEFNTTYRSYGISAPAITGPGDTGFQVVPCYNTIAHREGIKDGKYDATWLHYYNLALESYPTEAGASKTNVRDPIIARYTWDGVGSSQLDTKNTFAQWDNDREAIIAEIVTLKSLIDESIPPFSIGPTAHKIGGGFAKKVNGVSI